MTPRLVLTTVAFRDFTTARREPPTTFAALRFAEFCSSDDADADPTLSLLTDTGARFATRAERRAVVVDFLGAISTNRSTPTSSNA